MKREDFLIILKFLSILTSTVCFFWSCYRFETTHDLYYGLWAILFFMWSSIRTESK